MLCLSVSDTYHKISKAWVPTLFICVFTVSFFFFIVKKTDKRTFYLVEYDNSFSPSFVSFTNNEYPRMLINR